MFAEYKQGVAAILPIRLLDSAGVAVTGVLAAAVTATVRKADGTTASLTIDGVNNIWTEITTGAFSGKGVYALTIAAVNINVVGQMLIAITGGTGSTIADITIVANVEKDTYDRVGAPTGASISADIATVDTVVDAIKPKTDNLPADPASNTQVDTRLASNDVRLDNIDAPISSRATPADLPDAPDNIAIGAIKAKTDNLPADPASDTQVNTRLAAADYVAPANADVAAIKAKTDLIGTAAVASQADITSLAPIFQRILALNGANRLVDQEILDTSKRVTSARIRIYDSAANVQAAAQVGNPGTVGLLATYNVAASYTLSGACTMIVTEVLP